MPPKRGRGRPRGSGRGCGRESRGVDAGAAAQSHGIVPGVVPVTPVSMATAGADTMLAHPFSHAAELYAPLVAATVATLSAPQGGAPAGVSPKEPKVRRKHPPKVTPSPEAAAAAAEAAAAAGVIGPGVCVHGRQVDRSCKFCGPRHKCEHGLATKKCAICIAMPRPPRQKHKSPGAAPGAAHTAD
eukprot:3635670-Pleurochrysis_carterae.AAC.1